jgi:hypothetical protein
MGRATKSEAVKARMTAAQRADAAIKAERNSLATGIDTCMKAWDDRQSALEALAAADERLADGVAVLQGTGRKLEAIAELTDVPIGDVRRAVRLRSGEAEDAAPAAPLVPPVELPVGRPRAGRPAVPVGPMMNEGEPAGDAGDGGGQVDDQPAAAAG